MEKYTTQIVEFILGLLTGYALYKLSQLDSWKIKTEDKLSVLDKEKVGWDDFDKRMEQAEDRTVRIIADLKEEMNSKLDLLITLTKNK